MEAQTAPRMPKVVASTAPAPVDGREHEAAGGHQFAPVPMWIIVADISDRARRVWTYLRFRAGDDGIAWYRRRTLAEDLGLKPHQVKYDMTRLRKIGAIFSVPWVNESSERVSDCIIVWPKSVVDFTESNLRNLRGYGSLPTRENLPVEVRYVVDDGQADEDCSGSGKVWTLASVPPISAVGRQDVA